MSDAQQAAERAARKMTHLLGCELPGDVVGDIVERRASIILAEFAPLLAAKYAELARHHADAAETDASIRTSAKTVLPAEKVDGDRTCVPPVEEVVEMLVAEVAELRKVLLNCRPFLAVYVNLKQQIDAALAAKT